MKIAAVLCGLALAAAPAQTPRQERAKAAAAFAEKYRQGVHWMGERQWQRADTALTQALAWRENPDARRLSRICRINLFLERGDAALASGRLGNAVEHYQNVLDLDSHNAAATRGLRSAHYQISYREGVLALERHSYDEARRAFQRCLETRPDDATARGQLQFTDQASMAVNDYQAAWVRVGGCLQTADPACLDREMPLLQRAVGGLAGQPAPTSPNAALLPALLLYAREDRHGAERAARNCPAPAAPMFRILLRTRARYQWARRWWGWTAGMYGLTLLLSVYFGVRQVRKQQLVEGAARE